MNVRLLCGVFIRVILLVLRSVPPKAVVLRVVASVVFAGIFYTGWMAVAIPVLKSELDSLFLKAIIWLTAPVVTALGFATGVVISKPFLRSGEKSKFLDIFKWSLIGCAIGAGSFVWFGPMLIVFGMFAFGTVAIAIRETLIIRRANENIP